MAECDERKRRRKMLMTIWLNNARGEGNAICDAPRKIKRRARPTHSRRRLLTDSQQYINRKRSQTPILPGYRRWPFPSYFPTVHRSHNKFKSFSLFFWKKKGKKINLPTRMATDMRAHDEIQFDYFCIFRVVSFLEINKKKIKQMYTLRLRRLDRWLID